MMGCASEQGDDCNLDEKPAHQVTISDFYIGKYEVTQEQWQVIMGYNPATFTGNGLPVENVSWDGYPKVLTPNDNIDSGYSQNRCHQNGINNQHFVDQS